MKIRKELQKTSIEGRSIKLYSETSTVTGETVLVIKDSKYKKYPIKDYDMVVDIFNNLDI